jgi:ribosome assembly protein RRB1
LLASGDDKGEFRIWDLRMLPKGGSSGANFEFDSITRIRWHTSAITSLQFEPREDSVLAVCSEDNKLTLWDFSVEADESEQVTDEDIEIPPQLMFLHQGQNEMKELRFHPQYRTLLFTTAADSFNIFRPNLEPEEEEESKGNPLLEEETKQESTNSSATSKPIREKKNN